MSSRWMVAAAGAAFSIPVPAGADTQEAGARTGQQTQQTQRTSQDRVAYARAAVRVTRAASERDSRATNQRQDDRDRFDARS